MCLVCFLVSSLGVQMGSAVHINAKLAITKAVSCMTFAGGTAFSCYGGFWLGYGIYGILAANGNVLPPATGYLHGTQMMLIIWGKASLMLVVSVIHCLLTERYNVVILVAWPSKLCLNPLTCFNLHCVQVA